MRILITESKKFSREATLLLEKNGYEVVLGDESYATLQDKIQEFDGLIVRLSINFDEEIINKGSRLNFIATPTTGLDHIDLEEAKKRNIEVISLKGETELLEKITPTAELAVGLMLSVLRNIVPAAGSVNDGLWDRDKWVGRTMQGKTVGIVGMGRLGKITTRLVKAFGCDVVYYDPFVFSSRAKKVCSLNELAEKADVVSIHVHLNDETKEMIGEEFFNSSKKGQIIINTSRGAIIDERAMGIALKEGMIAGAGLDVLCHEIEGKTKDSVLVKYSKRHKNIVITPHIGGATQESMKSVEEFVVKKILRWSKEGAKVKVGGT